MNQANYITLRYAITEFTRWYGAIVVAMEKNVVHHVDGALKIMELCESMRDWVGEDILGMDFIMFNDTIKTLSRGGKKNDRD